MSSEGVAFLVVFAAVGAVPGVAALVAVRVTSRRIDARLVEILAILRPRQAKRAIGYKVPNAEHQRGPGETS